MERSRSMLILGGLAAIGAAALAAAAFTGPDKKAEYRADQEKVARIAQQGIRDFGSHDWADLCSKVAPTSSFLAEAHGIDGCATLLAQASTSPDSDKLETIAGSLTVDAKQVRITGDSALVPLSAIQLNGAPLPPMANVKEETLVRIKGQWYIMPN